MATKLIDDEKQLLLQIASGDEDAFAILYRQYYTTVQRFVLMFVKSEAQSDDIVQEVFIKIWEQRSRLTAIHSFKAYILVVSRNHTLNFLKCLAQDKAAISELIKHYQLFRDQTDEKIVSKEYWQWTQNILQTLPVQTRNIMHLCREEDKNYDEVAELLGISRHAVKKHMVRAHKVFRSSIKHLLSSSIKLLIALPFFK